MEFKTVGYLKENTPFSEIFPDRIVPIISIFPTIYRELDSFECYIVDAAKLSTDQINKLAAMLLERRSIECLSLEEALTYLQKGLPIKKEWFNSCRTSDPGFFFSMMLDFDQYE